MEQATLADRNERVVDAATYKALLVSRRQLVRADRRGEHLRGLHDRQTGETFLTDARKLIK